MQTTENNNESQEKAGELKKMEELFEKKMNKHANDLHFLYFTIEKISEELFDEENKDIAEVLCIQVKKLTCNFFECPSELFLKRAKEFKEKEDKEYNKYKEKEFEKFRKEEFEKNREDFFKDIVKESKPSSVN